jgi:hypothetical protein
MKQHLMLVSRSSKFPKTTTDLMKHVLPFVDLAEDNPKAHFGDWWGFYLGTMKPLNTTQL